MGSMPCHLLPPLSGFSAAAFKMDLSISPPFGGFELQALWDAAVGILPLWEMQACTLHTSVMHLPSVQPTISGGEYKPVKERKLTMFPALKASEVGRDQKRAKFPPFSRSWRRRTQGRLPSTPWEGQKGRLLD